MSEFYLGTAVVLIAIGQILQKLAAGQINMAGGSTPALAALVRSGFFWGASLAMAAGLVAWLMALSGMEVSKAYPLLGLSFVLTTLFSVLLLGERVSGYLWSGVCLISIGAAIMVVH